MSLDLTRAEMADAALKNQGKKWSPAKTVARRKAQIVTAAVFVLLLAATLGLVVPTPIHWYD